MTTASRRFKKNKRVMRRNTYQRTYKPRYNPRYDNKVLTGPEKKYSDVFNSLNVPIGSGFTITPVNLNPIGQGSGNVGRVGIKVCMKSILFRANILWNGGQTTNAPSQVRFVIVFDKQANGSLPARGDVFQDGTVGLTPLNLQNAERFVVLVDEWSDIGDNGQFTVTFTAFRKMSLEALYNSGSLIANSGCISVWAATNSGVNDIATGHFPAIEFYSRVRYTDV